MVSDKPETRSSQANRLIWALLGDIADQVVWHGYKLSKEDWKNVLSAGLKKQRIVPNIEGDGFVVLGQRTSTMTVKEMNELIELAEFFGGKHGVRFSAPEYREAA